MIFGTYKLHKATSDMPILS